MVNRMSKYTIEVRYIVETNSTPGKSVPDRIEEALPKIFDFSFPIFDENYRKQLETKIIAHYYTREIGFETIGLWKYYMWEQLNLIMPYYNKIYTSLQAQFNVSGDVDLTETHEGIRREDGLFSGTSSADDVGNASSSTSSKTITSDFPQAPIASTDYATTEADVSGNTNTQSTASTKSTTSNTNNVTGTDKYTKTRSGLSGHYTRGEILEQYTQELFNVDLRIIMELEKLFMMVY